MLFKVLGCSMVSLWLGISLFYTVVITPSAFNTVPGEHIGRFLSKTFSAYYRWGMVIFTLSSLIFVSKLLLTQAFLSFVSLTLVVFSEYLRKRIRVLRGEIEKNPEDRDLKFQFFNMHRLSAYSNFTTIFASATIVVISALGI